MTFTFEPDDFSLVKKAPLALNSLHCSRPGPRVELPRAREQRRSVQRDRRSRPTLNLELFNGGKMPTANTEM